MKCYMGKVLMVDLTQGTFEDIAIDDQIYRDYIGCQGLGVRLLYEWMKPGIDPLGPDNILGLLSGPFGNTGAPSAGRFVAVGKSPLTGGWGDANCGGRFGPEIKRTGYDGFFFKGQAEKPVVLLINGDKKELVDATALWGTLCTETEARVKEMMGEPRAQVACIGPAAERLSLISGIFNDGGRTAARSGLGAVMGAKNLKAVGIKGDQEVEFADPEAAKKFLGELRRSWREKPGFWPPLIKEGGTGSGYSFSVSTQDAPIKNWKGVTDVDHKVADASKLDGAKYSPFKTKIYACAQCSIACGAHIKYQYKDEGEFVSHRPEYETISAFGSLCCVDDIEAVMHANYLCNEYGLDTISAGATVAFAMECWEKGLLTAKDTNGLDLSWGNGDAMVELTRLMAYREGIGAVLADGVKAASERIGFEQTKEFAVHVGGQEPAMHDPRDNPGWGFTYAFDPTPGRHTLGGVQYFGADANMVKALPEGAGDKYDYTSKEKAHAQVVMSGWYQFIGAAGACVFSLLGYNEYPAAPMYALFTGLKDFDVAEACKAGNRMTTLKQLFNLENGVDNTKWFINRRMLGQPALSAGPVAGVAVDVDPVQANYFEEIGWDRETGVPTVEGMKRYGMYDLYLNKQSHQSNQAV